MAHMEYQQRPTPKSYPHNLFISTNNMDSFNWNMASPMSSDDQVLTPVASVSSTAGTPVKVEWPYAVGPLDFNLFDARESGPTVQTFYPNTGSAGVTKGQLMGLDEPDPGLNPLERLQRKWGIGDRKTRGMFLHMIGDAR